MHVLPDNDIFEFVRTHYRSDFTVGNLVKQEERGKLPPDGLSQE